MRATHNSVPFRRLILSTLVAMVGCAGVAEISRAADDVRSRARVIQHAQSKFEVARHRFETAPTNDVAAWEFARAGFDRAEFATNDTERAALAVTCIDACRKLLARDPKSAPGHYYLGMNLGQLARTKLLGALKIVDEMEREFKTAAALDELFDYAGPQRNLGLLYYEAPTIGSIGSRSKARKHLERAAELAPDFPDNRLNLAEACLKWRDKGSLKKELEALEKLWPAAKKNFAGPDWEAAWLDWSRREMKLRENSAALLKR